MTVYIIIGEGLIGKTPYSDIFRVYEKREKAAESIIYLGKEYPKIDFEIEEMEVIE